MTHLQPTRLYTGIWQSHNPHEREWIEEIFGPLLREQVTDGRHVLVLDNAILFDAFVYCNDPAYYKQFRGRNAFLVHFLDENFEGRYEEIYCNFRGVFRCFWSEVFNSRYVMKFPLGYCCGISGSGQPTVLASDRRYVWSFAGCLDKSSRPDMARALRRLEPHFLFPTDDIHGFRAQNKINGTPRRLSPTVCSSILLDSVFAPSPMGNVQLECFRLYEALELGAIPIVEKRPTLDYFRGLLGNHPIPTVRSWPEASALIEGMMGNPLSLNQLQEECLTWWRRYKEDFRNQVARFIEERAADSEPIHEPIVTRKFYAPGWRILELLRHHDLNATRRRVLKTVVRLIRQRKLRVALRP